MAPEVATSSFTGDPQPVEVLHAGRWIAGSLLGWRHDASGACRVRVRCVIGGLRHTAWTDLAHLRLPAPAGPPPADLPPPRDGDDTGGCPQRDPRPLRAGTPLPHPGRTGGRCGPGPDTGRVEHRARPGTGPPR